MSAAAKAEGPALPTRGSDQQGRRASDADRIVGERIHAYRIAAGITQQALAERIGVSYQQIQKYERGMSRVSAGRLAAIADAVGASTGVLMHGTEFEGGNDVLSGEVRQFLGTAGAVDLMRSWLQLPEPVRYQITALASVLAKTAR